MPLAKILECQVELTGSIFLDSGRYADPAWVGQAFKPRRNVHTIAENVVILNYDIALVDSNTKFDAVFSHVSIPLGHALLPFGCTAERIDDAGELNEKSVSGGLYQATSVLGDLGIDELAAKRSEPRERASFILSDQAAVTDHIGG